MGRDVNITLSSVSLMYVLTRADTRLFLKYLLFCMQSMSVDLYIQKTKKLVFFNIFDRNPVETSWNGIIP